MDTIQKELDELRQREQAQNFILGKVYNAVLEENKDEVRQREQAQNFILGKTYRGVVNEEKEKMNLKKVDTRGADMTLAMIARSLFREVRDGNIVIKEGDVDKETVDRCQKALKTHKKDLELSEKHKNFKKSKGIDEQSAEMKREMQLSVEKE